MTKKDLTIPYGALRAASEGTSYSRFAESFANAELQGRFAVRERVVHVSSEPQKAGAAAPTWANDPSGKEPPLGYAVDAVAPTGEAHELSKSVSHGLADTLAQDHHRHGDPASEGARVALDASSHLSASGVPHVKGEGGDDDTIPPPSPQPLAPLSDPIPRSAQLPATDQSNLGSVAGSFQFKRRI